MKMFSDLYINLIISDSLSRFDSLNMLRIKNLIEEGSKNPMCNLRNRNL